jgi:sn-glycerol 3-phosphate transport system permease protein
MTESSETQPDRRMDNRVYFRNKVLPYLLLTPQLAITLVFFIWPAGVALSSSFFVQQAFSGAMRFVGFDNFMDLVDNSVYLHSFAVTAVFTAATTLITLAAAMYLAIKAHWALHGSREYKAVLTWPYAVAPAVAGLLLLFLFNPSVGLIAGWLEQLGFNWDYNTHGNQAMILIVLAAAWRQIAYNFLFFLAGLQAVPHSLLEAAAIDGAGPGKRFWTIIFPLLTPTTFFLLVIDIVYSLFETFGLVDAITQGGPGNATNILVYQVYRTGFVGLDLGSSAAQSVILMLLVIAMTFIQFRFIERRVSYG